MPRTLQAVKRLQEEEEQMVTKCHRLKLETKIIDRIVEKLESRECSHRLKILGTRG